MDCPLSKPWKWSVNHAVTMLRHVLSLYTGFGEVWVGVLYPQVILKHVLRIAWRMSAEFQS